MMMSKLLLATTAALGLLMQPAAASLLQGPVVGSATAAAGKKSVLIIDIRGPTRATGDGVRVMGMIMDLEACGHHVEVISDALDYEELKGSWSHSVSMKYFGHIHFWKAQQNMPQDFRLTSFDRFIIGAKLDLFYTDGREGFAVPMMLNMLGNASALRPKVEAFWDDVPFERCLFKPEADEICPRVPAKVRQMAQIASKFYLLSVDDRERMARDMNAHGIPMDNVEFRIWPLKIVNMKNALHSPGFTVSPSRDLVTMMGNLHAVNREMVTRLFSFGVVARICRAIQDRNSNLKLLFMGGLADVALELKNLRGGTSQCVEVQTGFVSDEELEHKIAPRTRAVLNPFFQDVNSGISVKNFESIMRGVPFLTSAYGMHGLSDEIQACASFPMPSMPGNPSVFAQFVIDNVIDTNGYTQFANAFRLQAPKCIQGQEQRYPVRNFC